MRSGMTTRLLLGAAIVISGAGLAASRLTPRHPAEPNERRVPPPLAVQQSFRRFSEITGARLLDTLFKLGYHGGYSWDEKAGPVRPNLVVRTDSGTVDDSTRGVYEGILSLDFHHDVEEEVPPSLSLRFVSFRESPKWVLLTTDGLPEDPSAEMPLETIRKLPRDLHDAMRAPFADHADAFEFWKAHERKPTERAGAGPAP